MKGFQALLDGNGEEELLETAAEQDQQQVEYNDPQLAERAALAAALVAASIVAVTCHACGVKMDVSVAWALVAGGVWLCAHHPDEGVRRQCRCAQQTGGAVWKWCAGHAEIQGVCW